MENSRHARREESIHTEKQDQKPMTTRECKRCGLTAIATLAILMTSSCVTAHSHHHHRHHPHRHPHHRYAMAVTGGGTATWQNHERLTPDRCLAMAGPEAYDYDK